MTEKLKEQITDKLDKLKAKDIITIDVSKTSSLADYVIVATGRSSKHLSSVAENINKLLKQNGIVGLRPEGVANTGWIVLDAEDIIIHLFTKESREIYRLEELWSGVRR